MKSIKKLITALAGLALAAAAWAQYPTQSPVYIPNAIFAETAVSATGVASLSAPDNGLQTLYVRVQGAPSALVATIQGTESRGSAPAWSSLAVTNMATGAQQANITGAGLYRLNASGLAQFRVNTSTLTGTYTVSLSGGTGITAVRNSPATRTTYVSATATFAPAASATDFLVLPGNATTTVRLVQASCTGQGSATSAISLDLVKRSTLTSAGTSTTLSATPFDSSSRAASSVVRAYTANPTTGTLLGSLGVQRLVASTTASPTNGAPQAQWNFGSATDSHAQQVVLRGAAESVALNLAGVTVTNGTTLNCAMVWSEE